MIVINIPADIQNALPAPICNDELSAESFRCQLKTELYIRADYSYYHARECFTVRVGEHDFNIIIIIL